MNTLLHIHTCLLADIGRLTGFREIESLQIDMQWALHLAPQLEKLLLDHLKEPGSHLDLTAFPEQLRRLVAASVMDAEKLRYLRQLLLFSYKALVTHDHELVKAAIGSYIDCNSDVLDFGERLQSRSPVLLGQVARLVRSVLYRMDPRGITPGFGPGAVTTCKLRWQRAWCQIDAVWPLSDYMCLAGNAEHQMSLAGRTDDQIQAKLTAVPKDSRGPRLICVHPAEAVWFQQGMRKTLERAITRRGVDRMSPAGRVQFDTQVPNGRIALIASRRGHYATIDLKEASDRLSDRLVQALMGPYYKWFGCCRASEVVIRNKVCHLGAYAPMGNATVFPVQSLIFWAICVAALHEAGHKAPNCAFVFGDDIIVPSEHAEHVMNVLSEFGLVVNARKSFTKGFFRESCGVDAYKGVNVTPVRWKLGINPDSPEDYVALCQVAQLLERGGYWLAASNVYCEVEQWLARRRKRLFYTNNPDHGGIARYTQCMSKVWLNAVWHSGLQLFITPVYRVKEYPVKEPHGWNHVLDSVLRMSPGESPVTGAQRLLGRRDRKSVV